LRLGHEPIDRIEEAHAIPERRQPQRVGTGRPADVRHHGGQCGEVTQEEPARPLGLELGRPLRESVFFGSPLVGAGLWIEVHSGLLRQRRLRKSGAEKRGRILTPALAR
jgi:hypothetical protein